MFLLTPKILIRINQATVRRHGGNFTPPENLLHPQALDYIVEAVPTTMFGNELYPDIADKAAVYMHGIISNHVFQDGNKRTGLVAALLFLKLNGYAISRRASLENNDRGEPLDPNRVVDRETQIEFKSANGTSLYNFTLSIASGQLSLDDVRAWFAEHVVPL